MRLFYRGKMTVMGLMLGATVGLTAYAQGGRNSTYEVPPSGMLQDALIVNLEKARLHLRGDSATLDYRLPAELDGADAKRFFLTGSFDGNQWNLSTNDQANSNGDPSAHASCTGDEKDFTCVMNYAKNDQGVFPLDTAAADTYLQTRVDLTPEQVAHIKSAQLALSHEPIGIIRVRKGR